MNRKRRLALLELASAVHYAREAQARRIAEAIDIGTPPSRVELECI